MPKHFRLFRRAGKVRKEAGDHVSEIERIERVFACNISEKHCARHKIAVVLRDQLVRLVHGGRGDWGAFDRHAERQEHLGIFRDDVEDVLGKERILG